MQCVTGVCSALEAVVQLKDRQLSDALKEAAESKEKLSELQNVQTVLSG